jgi:hypothetical protein
VKGDIGACERPSEGAGYSDKTDGCHEQKMGYGRHALHKRLGMDRDGCSIPLPGEEWFWDSFGIGLLTSLLHEEAMARAVRARCREFQARGSSNKNSYFSRIFDRSIPSELLRGKIRVHFLKQFLVAMGLFIEGS